MTGRFCFSLIACLVLAMLSTGCEEKTATAESTAEKMEKNADIQQSMAVKSEDSAVEETEAEDKLHPQVVFEDSVYDFGSIDPGSKNNGSFKFKNEGVGVLKITRIKSTCGCTVPQLKKKEYLPDESGVINVTFKPGQRKGLQSKSIYVLSNDPVTPRSKLTIKADVLQKISYSPKKLNLRLDAENAGVQKIEIRSLDGKKFSVTDVRVRPAIMSIDYDPAAEAESFTLEPKVDTSKLEGKTTANVTLIINHPSQKNVHIPVKIIPKYKTDPSTLVALNLKPGASLRKTLYVKSNYGNDFNIASVTPANDSIKIVSQEKVSESYKIELDVIAPGKESTRKSFSSKINIKTDDGESLVVSCVGSVLRKD